MTRYEVDLSKIFKTQEEMRGPESSRIYFLPEPHPDAEIAEFDDLDDELLEEYAVTVGLVRWGPDGYIWRLNCSPDEADEIVELIEDKGYWVVMRTARRVVIGLTIQPVPEVVRKS